MSRDGDHLNVTGGPAAFAVLSRFLTDRNLTELLARVEGELVDATAVEAAELTAGDGLTTELLESALLVRSIVGRLNDVVHAATIATVLPQILEPGERITNRPSLGAGNSASRPFDLETDRRVAEFKVSQWKGADTMRKRGVFADLVNLALDDSGRTAQLYVVGDKPIHFLRTSTAKATWGIDRTTTRMRDRYAREFGEGRELTIAEFTAGPGAHIELIDLRPMVPALG
jgi:hypothetical protein